jgi:hypothetical protein
MIKWNHSSFQPKSKMIWLTISSMFPSKNRQFFLNFNFSSQSLLITTIGTSDLTILTSSLKGAT